MCLEIIFIHKYKLTENPKGKKRKAFMSNEKENPQQVYDE